jgi:hypothetical protein
VSCSSVNLLLRIVRLLGGEQNPNSKLGAFQGSRSRALVSFLTKFVANSRAELQLLCCDHLPLASARARLQEFEYVGG